MFSAVTHIWPDSHTLEKLDHLGIVVTIIGSPLSSLMVRCPFTIRCGRLGLRCRCWAWFVTAFDGVIEMRYERTV